MLVCNLLQIRHNVCACHKLSRNNDVHTLNLGLRKFKQETTAPLLISFQGTP